MDLEQLYWVVLMIAVIWPVLLFRYANYRNARLTNGVSDGLTELAGKVAGNQKKFEALLVALRLQERQVAALWAKVHGTVEPSDIEERAAIYYDCALADAYDVKAPEWSLITDFSIRPGPRIELVAKESSAITALMARF